MPKQDFEQVLTEAYAAADAAIAALFAEGKREQPFNCGFAWVTVSGNSSFARFCSKNTTTPGRTGRYGGKGNPGWTFWQPGSWPADASDRYQQDMDFHLAGARAFAKVLQSHGIEASVRYRLD